MPKRFLLAAALVGLLLPGRLPAQSLEGSVQSLVEENARAYARPVASGLSAALASGWFRTAGVRGPGHFYVGLDVMGAWVPEKDKTFRPVLPASITVEELDDRTYADPYGSSVGVTTPTAAGEGEGAVFLPQGQFRQDLEDAGHDPADFALRMPEGLGLYAVPSFVPRLTVGAPFATEITVRYLPSVDLLDEVGSVRAVGVGVRHQVNRWLSPGLPLDVSVAAGMQSLDVGALLSTETRTVQLAAGKDLGLAALYGAVRWEDSESTVSYTLDNPRLDDRAARIGFTEGGRNTFGLTVGATLDVLMKLNASYTFAEYSVLTAGAGFGI